MKAGLIQSRLSHAYKADYRNALDVQNYLQALVNYEAMLEWARRDDMQRVMGVVPPSGVYGTDKKEPWYRWMTGLIP